MATELFEEGHRVHFEAFGRKVEEFTVTCKLV
jgi:hypothetical protein